MPVDLPLGAAKLWYCRDYMRRKENHGSSMPLGACVEKGRKCRSLKGVRSGSSERAGASAESRETYSVLFRSDKKMPLKARDV